MIRHLSCPGCGKKLRVDDASGLKAGQCPKCGQKFRLPWAAPAAPPASVAIQPAPSPWAAPVPPPAASKAAAPDVWGAKDDGPAMYRFELDSPPKPPADALLEAEILDDVPPATPYDDYAPVEPRRRKKKRRRQQAPGMSLEAANLLISLGVLGGLWLIFTLLVIFKPQTVFVIYLLGMAIMCFAHLWLLIIAAQEDVTPFLLCLFVPFYELYFAVTRWAEAGKAMALQVFGFIVFLTAGIGSAVHDWHDGRDGRDDGGVRIVAPPGGHRPGGPPPGWQPGGEDDE